MKVFRALLAAMVLSIFAPWHAAQAADVICYNCPPEWADWATMLKSIKTDLGYEIPTITRIPARLWRKFSPRRPIRSAISVISA